MKLLHAPAPAVYSRFQLNFLPYFGNPSLYDYGELKLTEFSLGYDSIQLRKAVYHVPVTESDN